jgi:hypothetical protein
VRATLDPKAVSFRTRGHSLPGMWTSESIITATLRATTHLCRRRAVVPPETYKHGVPGCATHCETCAALRISCSVFASGAETMSGLGMPAQYSIGLCTNPASANGDWSYPVISFPQTRGALPSRNCREIRWCARSTDAQTLGGKYRPRSGLKLGGDIPGRS